MVVVVCPRCATPRHIKAELAGMARCRNCGELVRAIPPVNSDRSPKQEGIIRITGDRAVVLAGGQALPVKGRLSRHDHLRELQDNQQVLFRAQPERDGRTWAVAVEARRGERTILEECNDSIKTVSGGGGPGTGKRR